MEIYNLLVNNVSFTVEALWAPGGSVHKPRESPGHGLDSVGSVQVRVATVATLLGTSDARVAALLRFLSD